MPKKNETYIKLYRSTLDNALFNIRPFDDWRAFLYLILKARIKAGEVVLRDGTIVKLKRGHHFESKASLAAKFGWSVKKLKGWEKRMKKLKMVSALGLAKGTIYTVEKYTFFQGKGLAKGPAEWTSEGPTEGPRKKNEEECKRSSRAGGGEPPRELKVIPMPDDIRKKIEKVF